MDTVSGIRLVVLAALWGGAFLCLHMNSQGQTTVFWAALGAGKAFTAAVSLLPDGHLQARVQGKNRGGAAVSFPVKRRVQK